MVVGRGDKSQGEEADSKGCVVDKLPKASRGRSYGATLGHLVEPTSE